jgi:hypothetical protein
MTRITISEETGLPESDDVLDAMIARDLGELDGIYAAFRAWLGETATEAGIARLMQRPYAVSLLADILTVRERPRRVPDDLVRLLEAEIAALDRDREAALTVLGRWHDHLLATSCPMPPRRITGTLHARF